jgi:hypothetical protein
MRIEVDMKILILLIFVTGITTGCTGDDDDSTRVDFIQGEGIFHEQFLEGGFIGGEIAFDFIAGHPTTNMGLGGRITKGIDADIDPYPNGMQPRKSSVRGLDKRLAWLRFRLLVLVLPLLVLIFVAGL